MYIFLLALQSDKHVPMHLRRKGKGQKLRPKTFETMPSYGFLLPGQRHNIQVKFMPAEEVCSIMSLALSVNIQLLKTPILILHNLLKSSYVY